MKKNIIWTPKLKIISKSHSFKEQILKIVEDCNIVVDQIEQDIKINPEEPLIIITDDINIPEYKAICSEKNKENQLNIYIIFILSDDLKIPDHNRITIYNSKDLHKSILSKKIETLSITLMSEIREDHCLKQISLELEETKKLITEYEDSLQNVKNIQKYVMIPPDDMNDFETYTVFQPLRTVTGDVILAKQVFNKIFIMIADVTDHGYSAAIYGAALYALANNYIHESGIMGQDVGMWGHYMMKASGMFYPEGIKQSKEQRKEQRHVKKLLTANATFAVIDKMKQQINICFYGSGAEPPILINGDKAEPVLPIRKEEDKSADPGQMQSIGIGVPLNDGESVAKVYTHKFYPGDMAVFYTDGATEIFSDLNKEKDIKDIYSSDKILRSIKEAIEKDTKRGMITPKDIVSSVLRDANSYSIGTDILSKENKNCDMPNISDDLTIFCIKWRNNR